MHQLGTRFLWNLVGTASPLIVAVIAIPIFIEALGTARFGLLTIAWMIVGYFSLFDLGLGRALTKIVADKLGSRHLEDIPPLFWSAILIMTGLGVLGGLIFALITPPLAGEWLHIPDALREEARHAFLWLALSIPIVITSTGLRGVLEAHQEFFLVNIVRIPLGVTTFLGPLAVIPFSQSLVPILIVLVFARFLSWIAYGVLCVRVVTGLRQTRLAGRATLISLLGFGGWMTVTNVIGPLMVYLDRFIIGLKVSVVAVAYYATPFEIISKLGIVAGSLMGVIFPAFAAQVVNNPSRASAMVGRAMRFIFVSLFPIILIVVVFANEGLSIWLGSEFADNSTVVLQLLAVGILVNSLAQVPFGALQGIGRPNITGIVHMIELPIYIAVLWLLLANYGIVGAAIAWVARATLDAAILQWLALKLVHKRTSFKLSAAIPYAMAVASLWLGASLTDIGNKTLFAFAVTAAFVWASWVFILLPNERKFIRIKISAIAGAKAS